MATTIDALRNLGLKVNGSEPTGDYVGNVIDEIANSYSPSESGMSNPMTTSGDIIVGGASGAATRLAKGSQGQVLTVGSSGLEWATPSGGGGSGTIEVPILDIGSVEPYSISGNNITWHNISVTESFYTQCQNSPLLWINIGDNADMGFMVTKEINLYGSSTTEESFESYAFDPDVVGQVYYFNITVDNLGSSVYQADVEINLYSTTLTPVQLGS